MSQYFPKPYKSFGAKSDLKNATGIHTFKLAVKSGLASLKAEVDKLDNEKLKAVPVDWSKLGTVVNCDVVKNTVYDILVAKVNNVDTTKLVMQTEKIPGTSGLVKKKTDWNTKISEIESKIPSISGSATSSALTAVENKIPDVSSSVKKTNHDVKISEIEKKITDHDHEKYITTNNKLMSLNRKINSNKTKQVLLENELKNYKHLIQVTFRTKVIL